MTTLDDMVQEVRMNLEGFNDSSEQIATLTAAISSTSATTMTVSSDFGTYSIPRTVEIDDELFFVRTYSAGTLTVARGYRGTTAATHSNGAIVTLNPRIPKNTVKKAINDAIAGLYPRIPVIAKQETSYTTATYTYDIPATAESVRSISVLVDDTNVIWRPSQRWSFDASGGSTSTTGKTVTVLDGLIGNLFQVTYQKAGTLFTLGAGHDTDVFTTVTGYEEWVKDLVVLGACYRLAAFLDAARVTRMSAEQVLINTSTPASQSQSLSKYFLGLYTQRLNEAAARIQDSYPPARHYIN